MSETLSHAHASLRECHGCGLVQFIPVMGRDAQALCRRCGVTLRRTRPNSSNRALALTVTSLVLYVVAITAPFLTVDLLGKHQQSTMLTLPAAFVADGAWELGLVVLITAIIMPAAKIIVMLLVLVGLRVQHPPHSLPRIFRYYERIGPWAMVEVFLLGTFVAFTRLGAIARVETGVALYALGGLMLTMVLADAVLDADTVWERMEALHLVPPPEQDQRTGPLLGCDDCSRVNHAPAGAACSRCGSILRLRKPDSLQRTWALLGAAAILYIPANVFPVMTVIQLGQGAPSTILGGAQELLVAGMWPLALLVFVASIIVPVLKLVSLILMLVQTRLGSDWRLRDRTRLYRVVELIGRWSMVDVFMLATLVGLVRDGRIANITPGLGAVCFAAVVVLTMFASQSFDPRLMWDAAGKSAQAGSSKAGSPKAGSAKAGSAKADISRGRINQAGAAEALHSRTA